MLNILIQDLHLNALIGEYEEERLAPQPLILHIGLTTTIDPRTVQEDLRRTLDYDALTQRIIQLVEGSSYRLLETLCAALSDFLLEDERVQAFDLKIEKPQALERAIVALHIQQKRA